jgi:hypothetical protein
MIDPKLNELPADRNTAAATDTAAQSGDRARRARAGLSVNDTIAGDTLLSTGSRGVDVSGVEAGAGAGAGSTALTPGASNSPAPNVMPGSRSTGMTPRGTTASGQSPAGTAQSGATVPGVTGVTELNKAETSAPADEDTLDENEIAGRAYQCWHERGCPSGSPEVDWHRAIQDIRERRRAQRQERRFNTSASA